MKFDPEYEQGTADNNWTVISENILSLDQTRRKLLQQSCSRRNSELNPLSTKYQAHLQKTSFDKLSMVGSSYKVVGPQFHLLEEAIESYKKRQIEIKRHDSCESLRQRTPELYVRRSSATKRDFTRLLSTRN